MKRIFTFFIILLSNQFVFAQSKINGLVTDIKDKPVVGANIYLDNTLDGATTDSSGHFHFITTEKGAQKIIASNVGYANGSQDIVVNGDIADLVLKMKALSQNLDGVTITAGAFEASNNKNKAVLSTLDIITTAGANADVVKAITTLPGTQQQGTETGLFVRGGDASEAAVIVDGLIAQNAFFSGPPGVATRSRFSAFQFNGVSFSSGGYSARYGQALSSVLELNTLDFPDKSNVNLGVNMAGIYASADKLYKNSSIEGTVSYNNLQPFYSIAKTNVDYFDVPKGYSASVKYVWKPIRDGTLKVLVNGSKFRSGVTVPNPDSAGKLFSYDDKNSNVYSNISYKQMFGDKWMLFTAASYSYNKDEVIAGYEPINEHDDRTQFRLEMKRYFHHFNVLLGTEIQHYAYHKTYFDTVIYPFKFQETQPSAYLEAEWKPATWISIRPGLRYEHSALLNENVLGPRFSMALRTGRYSQIGLAGGLFSQDPDVNYLLYGYRLQMQEAQHYIANFQWIKGDRTLRLEGYYKKYTSLVRENDTFYDPNSYRTLFNERVDNSGYGYAEGIELFYRDKKTIKNLDYWISYSYIDTKRLYQNYLQEATPDFIANHNLSIVSKYWIDKLHSQINVTYSYASGRPYYNPNLPATEFLSQKTPDFHNLAFTFNYLTHIKKWFTVIYAGVDNVTNHHNVFGYRYSTDGMERYAQLPALYRSVFVGINFSLTEFKKDEL